jgi:type II secretory pathway component PulF
MSIIIVGLIVWLYFRSETGKKTLHELKIKTPMVGKIQINTITARFARSFSLLLESGMDLASALDSTSIILGNSYIEKRFKEAASEVRQGVTMTNAFQKQKIFPTMLIQMLAVGERTAALEEVLNRSCAFFDEQVEASLASFTSKIQPIMLAIMGGVIGTLFIAIYSPMLSIMQTL